MRFALEPARRMRPCGMPWRPDAYRLRNIVAGGLIRLAWEETGAGVEETGF